ncbi:MAG: glycosyltransferase family 4 protein [Paludibacteraceae bacterium]|nr:glycosyltransferase family 4 protein [Paludibacteraceae bacterium]
MKRFLVVSDPPAAPGYLPRVRFLCEYLVRKGCDVTLLTEEYQPLPFPHSYPIETIKMYSGGIFDWLVKTVWTLLTDWHNRVFACKALNTIHQTPDTFDFVICSAFSDFPLGAAQRIANKLQVPLLCDIRDLDEQVENSRYQYHHQTWWTMPFRRLYRAVHIRRRNKVLRAADNITTVSPWHAEFIKQFNPNVQVLYNGFDDKQFYPEDIRTNQFTISYIGSLFEWQQPALTKVRQVIEELNKSQLNPQQSKILLDIHTPGCSPVPYNRLGSAIRKSSIMLVLTSPDTHGMLTTKFYEALGCEKPILCVPSDRGALAELIAFTKAGIATDDEQEMARFLLDKYQEWQKNGFTRQKVQHKEHFARDAQYDQYYSAHI